MTGEMATQIGDVIVLKKSGDTCIVCFVVADGQQSYGDVEPETLRSEALAMEIAQSCIGQTKGSIFIRDLDSGEWDKISN